MMVLGFRALIFILCISLNYTFLIAFLRYNKHGYYYRRSLLDHFLYCFWLIAFAIFIFNQIQLFNTIYNTHNIIFKATEFKYIEYCINQKDTIKCNNELENNYSTNKNVLFNTLTQMSDENYPNINDFLTNLKESLIYKIYVFIFLILIYRIIRFYCHELQKKLNRFDQL